MSDLERVNEVCVPLGTKRVILETSLRNDNGCHSDSLATAAVTPFVFYHVTSDGKNTSKSYFENNEIKYCKRYFENIK